MINFIRKNAVGFMGLFIFFALLYGMLREDKRMKLFQNSKITFGYLISKYSAGKNPTGTFLFIYRNKMIKFDNIGDYSQLNKGDTVLIEYAIEDPTVARVKDKYVMQKFKHLRKVMYQ